MSLTVLDLINALSPAPLDARVVLRTAGGDEIDLGAVQRYAQLVVVYPAMPVATESADLDGFDLLPYREVLDRADAPSPEDIENLINCTPASFDEMAAMLIELWDRDIDSVAGLVEALDAEEAPAE